MLNKYSVASSTISAEKLVRVFFIIGIGIIYLLALNTKASTSFFSDEIEPYTLFVFLYFFIAVYLFYILLTVWSVILTKIDCFIGLSFFLLWVINPIKNQHGNRPEELEMFVAVGVIYLLVRTIRNQLHTTILLGTIAVSYFVEIVMAVRENGGNLIDGRILFSGTLNNPALYAAYMTSIIPLILYIVNKLSKPIKIVVCILLALSVPYIYYYTLSRGAFISLVVIMPILGCIYFPGLFSKIAIAIKNNKIILVLGCGLLCLLGVFLFFFKENSSIGRLLIWTISVKAFLTKPLLGWGLGHFALNFPIWQYNYFSTHSPCEKFKVVADVSYAAFNEYLQLLV